MLKRAGGDHFEDMQSLKQNLTFEAAHKEFSERNLPFGQPQMKTSGISRTSWGRLLRRMMESGQIVQEEKALSLLQSSVVW